MTQTNFNPFFWTTDAQQVMHWYELQAFWAVSQSIGRAVRQDPEIAANKISQFFASNSEFRSTRPIHTSCQSELQSETHISFSQSYPRKTHKATATMSKKLNWPAILHKQIKKMMASVKWITSKLSQACRESI